MSDLRKNKTTQFSVGKFGGDFYPKKEKSLTKNSIDFLIILFIILNATVFIFGSHEFSLYKGNTSDFSQDWRLITSSFKQEKFDSPARFDIKTDENYTIIKALPFEINGSEAILIRASMQYFDLYVDDELIYSHQKVNRYVFENKPNSFLNASEWHLVKLNPSYEGKMLKLVIHSPVKAFSGLVNSFRYGSVEQLIFYVLFSHLPSLFIAAILLIIAFCLLIFGVIRFFVEDGRLIYLGLASLSSAIWVLSEAKLLQFITGSRLFIAITPFTTVSILVACVLMYFYLATFTNKKFKISTLILAMLNLVSMILVIIFQFTGIINLRDSWIINIIIFFISFITVVSMIYIENRKDKKSFRKQNMKYVWILFIAAIFELISFILRWDEMTTQFFKIGVVFFFVLLIQSYFSYHEKIRSIEIENEVYKKMAYMDFLTGGYNRNAYEQKLKSFIDNRKEFRLVLADINNLKFINDNYSHKSGDEAIKISYACLKKAFSKLGNCYRTGGDELALLLNVTDFDEYKKSKYCFEEDLAKKSETFEFELKLAFGTDIYEYEKGIEYNEFYKIVDEKMYKEKRELKADLQVT